MKKTILGISILVMMMACSETKLVEEIEGF